MTDLLTQFISESRDLLEKAASGMLALEKSPDDAELVNQVFRAVHTLKGASGLFDIGPLTNIVHAGEDLLGAVRGGMVLLDPGMVDLLLDSLDQVNRWLDDLESAGALPADAPAQAGHFVVRLRALLEGMEGTPDAGTAAGAGPSAACAPWLGDFAEADRLAALARALDGDALWAVEYLPDSQCFFSGEDPLHLCRQVPDLLAIAMSPSMALPPLDALDPFICFTRFRLLTAAPIEQVRDLFRYVPDQVTVTPVRPHHLVLLQGEAADGPVFQDFAQQARGWLAGGRLDRINAAARSLLDLTSASTRPAAGLRALLVALEPHGQNGPLPWLGALIDAIGDGAEPDWSAADALVPPPAAAPEPAPADGLDPTARAILNAQVRLLESACSPEVLPGHIDAAGTVLRNVLLAVGRDAAAAESAVKTALELGNPLPLSEAIVTLLGGGNGLSAAVAAALPGLRPVDRGVEEVRAEIAAAPKVLKVDQTKIDALMNLIGELIVAKNGLPYLSRRAEETYGSREMAREIKDQHAVIDRIAQELQAAIMMVRMLPVGQVFQRFPRLVRDLARRLDKRIELVITGEETEADKTVIESLVDPLVHMIRNAIDHGIEAPEARIAAGKPAQGTIRLTAGQENDRVHIEVSDDGAGIDPDMVRRKAVQRGLLSAEAADALSDAEAVNLVFAAGFSTREQVSDLSGRGVGMDVVRSAVEKAGGTVSLSSVPGQGSSVRLSVPLTMAVTRIMTVDVDGHLYGIPMDIIVETVRVPRSRLHMIRGDEAFVLRDNVVPLVRLGRVLGLPETGPRAEEEAVMVVRIGRERLGVVVGGFRESLEVIVKPMDGILSGMPGYAGTALLGDGRVLLVLSLKELV